MARAVVAVNQSKLRNVTWVHVLRGWLGPNGLPAVPPVMVEDDGETVFANGQRMQGIPVADLVVGRKKDAVKKPVNLKCPTGTIKWAKLGVGRMFTIDIYRQVIQCLKDAFHIVTITD